MPAYTNPVYQKYFADPFVWRDGIDYYAIGTGDTEAAGAVDTSAGDANVFPLLHSRNLVQWRELGRALIRPDAALGDTFWAPEVIHADGTWYLYYSVGFGDKAHHLRVATSSRPGGPYRDAGIALTRLPECAFAIDAHPFRDDDGRYYLFYARDFLDVGNDASGVRAGTALVVQSLATMTELTGEPRTVLRARCDWQRFLANRPMYGATYDWHTLEGPCAVKHAGRYYCFYSGGCWQDATYGVDYAVADHVLGPYSDEGAEVGPRILRSVSGRVIGPGHTSIVSAPELGAMCMFYHAWSEDMVARRMCMDRLVFTERGPRCDGPTWTEQRTPSDAAVSFAS